MYHLKILLGTQAWILGGCRVEIYPVGVLCYCAMFGGTFICDHEHFLSRDCISGYGVTSDLGLRFLVIVVESRAINFKIPL